MNIYKKKHSRQSGFSLYLVLIMMLVIAFIVVATMQSTSMNMRTAANDSDYQLSRQNAEAGLKAAQDYMRTWPIHNRDEGTKYTFKCKCEGGLCAAKWVIPTGPNDTELIDIENCGGAANDNLKSVWEREKVFSDASDDPSIKSENSDIKFRYVIEYLGINSQDNGTGMSNDLSYIFRVTAKGWGVNKRTTSIIEETLQVEAF